MKLTLIVLAIITSLSSPAYAPPLGSASWIVTLDGEEMPLSKPYTDEFRCRVSRDFYQRERPDSVALCVKVGG